MSKCVELTADSFEAMTAQPAALIDFWMPGCPPCKMMEPILDELAAEYDGKVAIGKINASDNIEIAVKYGVMSVPTLIVFKSGNEVERFVGAKPKAAMIEWLDSVQN